ncbi:MAG: hypothetical protein R3220_05700 [Balneolaceae bacterium]|nr:hypothetical protein [Balneolaceae bacterium]
MNLEWATKVLIIGEEPADQIVGIRKKIYADRLISPTVTIEELMESIEEL